MASTASLADAPSIGEEELHHQRVPLMRRAETFFPGAGWRVYQLWREFNKKLFGRQMSHCELRFGSVPENRFGLWRKEGRSIILSPELLHQHGKVWRLYHVELSSNFPPDVLLRQMVFQYLETVRDVKITDQVGVPIKPLSENEWWLKEINRLSEEMGLDQPKSPEKARWWPHTVRPNGYYDGDWAAIVAGEG